MLFVDKLAAEGVDTWGILLQDEHELVGVPDIEIDVSGRDIDHRALKVAEPSRNPPRPFSSDVLHYLCLLSRLRARSVRLCEATKVQ